MRFKKTVMTGALALSVIVGTGSAYASPSTSADRVSNGNIADCYGLSLNGQALNVQSLNGLKLNGQSLSDLLNGLSLNDLLQSIQQGKTTIVWPGMSNGIPGSQGGGADHNGSSGTDQGSGDDGTNGGQAGGGTETGTVPSPGAGTGNGTGTGGTPTGNENAPTSAYAEQVVSLVNQERAKAGLKPLASDAALTNMALDKAKDMYNNNYFDHTSPTYGSPFDMMKSYGIQYSYAGENIAKGQRNPQEVMNAWMNSEGHRQNIMSPNFTKIGVAYYNGEWVQEFIAN
ncbi:CAP domain-containing protein [Paenibacillus hodogayensis]|uniref:CAP domain-containing protein n=1 Tax=Paenibacillus hodogayensis TaxID=279208 RepID=A0ABV5VRU7_9BACL